MSETFNRRRFFRSMSAVATASSGSSLASTSGGPATSSGELGTLPISVSPLARAGASFVNPKKVLLWERTRKEIRESLAGGRLKAAILPTGSVEQHNEHMALIADVAISTLISQQVALQLYPRVLVAPPSPCGYAPYHMARKGTITLRKETFQAYVFDVLESLKAHGIRNILVLNGHGGNHQPLQEMLPAWRRKLGINLDADSYWSAIPKETMDQIIESEKRTSHAGEFETSIYLAAFPDRVRTFTMEKYDQSELNYESNFLPGIEKFLGRDPRSRPTGLRGENKRDRARQKEALLATAEKGETILATATQFFAKRLEKMIAEAE